MNLGKSTFVLKPKVEKALRKYVSETYPLEPYGKLSKVVNDAIEYYLGHIGKYLFLDG